MARKSFACIAAFIGETSEDTSNSHLLPRVLLIVPDGMVYSLHDSHFVKSTMTMMKTGEPASLVHLPSSIKFTSLSIIS